jgi:hypothetical protein
MSGRIRELKQPATLRDEEARRVRAFLCMVFWGELHPKGFGTSLLLLNDNLKAKRLAECD